MVNFYRTVETQQRKVSASKKYKTFYIDSSRSALILGIIAQLLVLLELFKNRDFSRFCMGKGVQEVALCKRWSKLLYNSRGHVCLAVIAIPTAVTWFLNSIHNQK